MTNLFIVSLLLSHAITGLQTDKTFADNVEVTTAAIAPISGLKFNGTGTHSFITLSRNVAANMFLNIYYGTTQNVNTLFLESLLKGFSQENLLINIKAPVRSS